MVSHFRHFVLTKFNTVSTTSRLDISPTSINPISTPNFIFDEQLADAGMLAANISVFCAGVLVSVPELSAAIASLMRCIIPQERKTGYPNPVASIFCKSMIWTVHAKITHWAAILTHVKCLCNLFSSKCFHSLGKMFCCPLLS